MGQRSQATYHSSRLAEGVSVGTQISSMEPDLARARIVYHMSTVRGMTRSQVAAETGLTMGQVARDVARYCRLTGAATISEWQAAREDEHPAFDAQREDVDDYPAVAPTDDDNDTYERIVGLRSTPPREQVKFEESDSGATAWSKSARIMTLEQLLNACDVDRELWTVDRYVVNKWEVGARGDYGLEVEPLIQVKAWLKRREAAPVEQALESVLARMRDAAPFMPRPTSHAPRGDHLLVPNLYDAHFNKRSDDGTYTVERAADDFCAVADALALRVEGLGMPVERVLFPAGNDALHTDNLQGTTTKGTWVETAGDARDAVDAVVDAYQYVIRRFAEIAPVDVVVVESNHDRFSSYWLGKVIEAMFSRDPFVSVDARRAPNKYYAYGATLIGLQHGDSVKVRDLAALMAVEAPQLWAETRYRQWLRGHIHHSAGIFHPISEEKGVNVRVIPALCPPDQYHILHGFIGGHRAAEALYFHREHGPGGSFPVFVDEVTQSDELPSEEVGQEARAA